MKQRTKNPICWEIQQLDAHGQFLVTFGIYTNKEQAVEAFMTNCEKLYPGFQKDIYKNGNNQWVTDKYEFIINLKEIVLNTFEEI